MKNRILKRLLLVILSLFTFIQSLSFPSVYAIDAQITDIQFDKAEYIIETGEQLSINVTAFYSDSTEQKISNLCTYSSTDTSISEIDSSGTLTGKSAGETTISAAYQGMETTARVIVEPGQAAASEIIRIQFDKEQYDLISNDTVQTVVSAVYSDNTVQNIAEGVQYYSEDSNIAEISQDGTIFAKNPGQTQIFTQYGGLTGSAVVYIQPISLEIPQNLRAEPHTTNITVYWDIVPEISSYDLMIDGTCQTVTETVYNHSGIGPDTSHTYQVRSRDGEEVSDWSAEIISTALPDEEAPSIPANLILDHADSNTVTLCWAPSTDNVEVSGYEVYRNGNMIASTIDTTYSDAITSVGSFTYTVRAFDSSGNYSSMSSPLVFDNQPPGAPTGLNISARTHNSITLSWNEPWEESTDNTGIAQYEIYDGRNLVQTVHEGNTSVISGLQPDTQYNFSVRAVDMAGNTSGSSEVLTVKTLELPLSVSSNLTLSENIECGHLYLKGGSLDLNGYSLTVEGSLYQTGGTMNIDGGQLIVSGDYRIENNGSYTYAKLKMVNGADYVRVGGNFVTRSYDDHTGLLTAGILEVKGDFTQRAYSYMSSYKKNFNASGTHKVILSGTALQTVDFEYPTYSKLNVLELKNYSEEGVKFNSRIAAADIITNNCEMGALTIESTTWNLTGDTIINDSLTVENSTINLNGFDLAIRGVLNLNGTINLNGRKLTVEGSLYQTGGTMNIDGGQLIVSGDYRIENNGSYTYAKLKMVNGADYVRVGGNFVTRSYDDHTGLLTAGILEVKGDFTQRAYSYMSSYKKNFNASGTHKVILSGSALQTVDFEYPTYSKLNVLELKNYSEEGVKFIRSIAAADIIANNCKVSGLTIESSAWSLTGDTEINGSLTVVSSTINLNGFDLTIRGDLSLNGTINLSGRKLTVEGGLYQAGGTMNIDGGELIVSGDYRIENNVSYTNAVLKMVNGADYVRVGGNFVTRSYDDHTGLLTAGILEVKGDFTQRAYSYMSSYKKNFNASGTHKVILSGTALQTVDFEYPTYSKLNVLELKNYSEEGVKFNSRIAAADIIANNCKVSGLTIESSAWSLTGDTEINGSLTVISSTINLNGFDLAISGDLNLNGTINLNGRKLTVEGGLYQTGGTMNIDGGQLIVSGDYRIENNGTYVNAVLKMVNGADYVRVGGNFVTRSYDDHTGLLTAGILEVKGDFTQRAYSYMSSYKKNFNASGTHKVILSGTALQTVNFEYPSYSRFCTLSITKPLETGYSFNIQPLWGTLLEEPADIEPPTVPAGLTAIDEKGTTITLSWSSSTDNIRISGYEIYRDGFKIGSTSRTSYTDTGLQPDTEHEYAIKAYDVYGNLSELSESVTIATAVDDSPPSSPQGLIANDITESTVTLSWIASSDNVAVEGYNIYNDMTVVESVYGTVYTLTGLNPDTSYRFTVRAFDAAGNLSQPSNAISVKTAVDTQIPTAPQNVTITAITVTSVTFKWDESTDNISVAGYVIYRNGIQAAITETAGYTDFGLEPDTLYTYAVRAYDAADNLSEQSSTISVTTYEDTEAPTSPEGLCVDKKTGTSVTLTWLPSDDNVSVTGYEVYRDGILAGFSENNAFKDTGLVSDTEYEYTVLAYDAAGNKSGLSSEITVIPVAPHITRIVPANGEKMGGARSYGIYVYFVNTRNVTGSTAIFEFSADGTEWTRINSTVYGPDSNSYEAWLHCDWDLTDVPGGSYFVRCTVFDETAVSDSMTVTYQIDRTAPSVPRNLTGEADSGIITLTWEPCTEADLNCYKIYRANAAEGNFTEIAVVSDLENLIYTDYSTQAGQTYAYKITAADRFNQESESSNSVEVLALADITPPAVLGIEPLSPATIGRNADITVRAEDNLLLSSITLQYSQDDGLTWTDIETVQTTGTAKFNWSAAPLEGEVRVRAIARDSNGNESDGSPERVYTIDCQGPAKVEGFTATPSTTAVTLHWNNVPDQDFSYFQVEWKSSAEAEYAYYDKTGATLGMYIKNLKPLTDYWFRVVAYDIRGNRGTISDEISVKTTADISAPVVNSISPEPSRVQTEIPLSSSVSDNVGIASFKFQMSRDLVNWADIKAFTLDNVQPNATFSYDYDVSSLQEGSCYIRGIAADESGNASDASNTICVEYIIDRTAPSMPEGLVITPDMGYLALSWDAGSEDDLAYYRLYRAETEYGPYAIIANSISSLGYYDKNVLHDRVYFYKLKAVDLAGNESLQTEPVSGELLPDIQAPVIYSMNCPSYNGTLPANPRISVFTGDNYSLASISIEYKLKNSADDKWTIIGEEELSAVSTVYSVVWNTGGLTEDEYLLRAVSKDVAGNESEPLIAEYMLNLLPPSSPVLAAAPGGWKISLSWTSGEESDLAGFRVYRSTTPNGSSKIIKETAQPNFIDEMLTPGQNYYYKIQALDLFGNSSWSNIETEIPLNEDTYLPTARAGEDVIAAQGMEVAFDGTFSTDNDRIESYSWDFGDGSSSILAQPVHAYDETGTYYAILTVSDPAGNTATDTVVVQVYPPSQVGTLEIRVVDTDTGVIIPGAYVYIDFPDDSLKQYTTDSSGISKVTATAGNYNVSVYKTGYLPVEENIQVVQYRKSSITIRIERGELVVGDLAVRRLELQEIMDAGIDVTAPENQFVYKFSVNLKFQQAPLPVEYVYVNGFGEILIGGIIGSGGSGGKRTAWHTKAIPHPDHPEVPPILAFITIENTVTWLKEFFEVGLILYNMADTQYVIADSAVTLQLPEGLSLAPTREGQDLTVGVGDLGGQETRQVKWIIRGDKKGDYDLDAYFKGTLLPFEAPVNAHFRTSQPFRVLGGDALRLFVQPEIAAYIGEKYYVQFALANVSDTPIYNLTTTFGAYCEPMPRSEVVVVNPDGSKSIYVDDGSGEFVLSTNESQQNLPFLQPGDTVKTDCLKPGEVIYGTYCTDFDAEGDPDEVYYKLVESFTATLDGSNTEIPAEFIPIPSHVSKYKVVEIDLGSFWADPVDASSGAHIIEREALAVRGATVLSLDLAYNSMLLDEGDLGKGWSHNFETRLAKQPDGTVRIYWSPSNFTTFLKKGFETRATYGSISEEGTIIVSSGQEPQEQEYVCNIHAMKDYLLKKNADGTYTLTCVNKNKYIFDETGRLIRLEDRNGKYVTLTYTADSIVVTEPASGQTLTLNYNAQGLLESVTDKAGRGTTFTYNGNKCLTGITDPEGRTTAYTYDSSGRVLTGRDGDGKVLFANTYDAAGRIASQDDGIQGNTLTQFRYDDTSEFWRKITTVTDRNGNTRKYVHDRFGQLIRVEDELGNTTTFTYDGKGNRTSMTDPNGNTTLYAYDDSGNLLTITDAEGLQVVMTYDGNGNALTVEDAGGNKTVNTYDQNNLLLSITDPLGNTTGYTYNQYGQMLSQIIQGEGTTTFTYENGLMKTSSDHFGNVITYGYDSAGRITSITDREGNTTAYEYDAAGNLLSETDAMGNRISYAYDSRGNILSQTDQRGNITAFKYNKNGKLEEATDPQGSKTTYEYDNEDRLTKTTDPQGNTTEMVYDAAGRLTCTNDALGNTTSFTYDNLGNILTETTPGKGTISYTYYKNGKLHTVIDANGYTTTYYYDDEWRVSRITNQAGKSASYTYDASGNLLTETDPLGNTIIYAYDNWGNIISKTDAKGNTTRYKFNVNNMLTSVTDALNNTTQYKYDKEDRLKEIIDARGNSTTFTYDKAGKVSTVTDALGNSIATEYDASGNIIKIKDAYGADFITTTFDSMNRPDTVTDALGNVTINKYDSLGRLIEAVDALNRSSRYGYDKMNRLVSVIDPLNGISSQTFDKDGNLKSVTDPNGNAQEFAYDPGGRLISETTAIGSVKTYGYNVLNLLSEMKNGRGQNTAYLYDDAGRLISFSDPTGTVEYTYDANGNVLSVIDSTGTITREYDKLDRVTKYTDCNGNTVEYSYDELGNLIALTYPGGKIVRYRYDAVNRLVSVTDWANRVTTYDYDKNGRLIKTKRPNGTEQSLIYDAAGNVLQQTDTDREGNIIVRYDYTYDAAGNVTVEQSTSEPQYFEMPDAVMAYDKGNRLISYNGQAVEYDADGNMTYGPLNGEMVHFAYDARNRLVSAGNVSYEYDAENNRIAAIENGERTEYVNNPHAYLSQLLMQKDSQGGITYYIYGSGLIGHEAPDGTYATYHFDRRGSTVALTDINGSVTDTFEYAPYGELAGRTGNTSTPFLFNGRDGVMTDGNGLYYMRARYYNPDIKRFINQDVIQGSILDGRGLNKYAYANGNPVSLIDPFGLLSELSFSTIGHTLLDLVGFIPVIGDIADAVNAVWYLAEGDYENAAYSAISILPAAGSIFAKGVKWGSTAFKSTRLYSSIVKYGSRAIDYGKMIGRTLADGFSRIGQAWKNSRVGKLLASNAGYVKLGFRSGDDVASVIKTAARNADEIVTGVSKVSDDVANIKSIRRYNERLVQGKITSSNPTINKEVRAIQGSINNNLYGKAGTQFHSLNFRLAQDAKSRGFMQNLNIDKKILTPGGIKPSRRPDYYFSGGGIYDLKPWRNSPSAYDHTPQFQDINNATGNMPVPLYYNLWQ